MAKFDEEFINAENQKMSEAYTELGKMYYAAHKNNFDPEFADVIGKIKACEEAVIRHKDEELKKEGLMLCRYCGSEIMDVSRFCNFCGKPVGQSEPEKPAAPVPAPAAAPTVKRCSFCGFTTTDDDVMFCTECGSKLG